MKHNFVTQLLICNFLILTNYAYGQRDSLWTADQLSNITVYLIQKNLNSSPTGTGTIINHNKKFYLLTASHVAKEMNNNPKIVFRTTDDKPIIINLREITTKNQLNWLNHPEADISIIEIIAVNKDIEKRLSDWSFSSKFIYNGTQVIARDNDLTFFGFPILDLELKHFSPLSFTAFPASGLLTNKRYDIDTKCSFFYLDQPSMQGCSGSGVYCSVKKNFLYMGMGKTLMIGIVHGTAKDDTGRKLAAICPSFYIWDLLKQVSSN